MSMGTPQSAGLRLPRVLLFRGRVKGDFRWDLWLI